MLSKLRLVASLVRRTRTDSTTRPNGSLACLSALSSQSLNSSARVAFSAPSVDCFHGVNFFQSRGSCVFHNQASKLNVGYSNFPFIQKRNFCTSTESNNNSDNKEITLSLLSNACKNGDIEQVRELLKAKVDINTANNRFPPLIVASANGHLQIVKLLIDNGANINILGKNGFTPLLSAIEASHFEIVELLLQRHADPNFKAYAVHKVNPLKANTQNTQNTQNPQNTQNAHNTLNTENPQNPQNTHNTQSTQNPQNTENTQNSFFSMIERNLLKEYRTNPTDPNDTTLDWDKVIQVTDKIMETNTKYTPADKAFYAKIREFTLAIADEERSPPKDANGSPQEHSDSLAQKYWENIVSSTQNTNKENQPETMKLFKASLDFTDALITLGDHNININQKNPTIGLKKIMIESGVTPLHIACAKNDEKIFDLLLRYGAKLDVLTNLRQLPIHLTRKRSIIEKILRIAPQHVHAKGARGLTPLHWAILKNDISLAIFLLKKGAAINTKDDHGRTPLELCPSKEFGDKIFKSLTSK